MSKTDALQTVLTRNHFYRDGYRTLMKVAFVQGAVILVLIAIIVLLVVTSKVEHVFFATGIDGRIMPVEPASESYFSRDQVTTWAAKTAREVMQLDYLNYRTALDAANSHFTQSGRVAFQNALKESRLLESIEKKKLITQLKIEGAPSVIREGTTSDGVYAWSLKMPISIIYDGQEAPQSFRGVLSVRVDRVNFLENPEGIAFSQWVIGTGATNEGQ